MTASFRLDLQSTAVTLLLLALILYGSLYPFQFDRTAPANLLAAFWATARARPDRGDVISNVLLYLPLGFFAVRCFPRTAPALLVMLTALAGALLSTSIELAQFYDDHRAPSFFDAAANFTGTTLGALAGVLVRQVSAAMLLAAAWFFSRLVPYVPSFDVHKYAFAARQLFTLRLDPLDFFHYLALWLTAAALLQALFEKRGGRALLAGIALVVAARIVVRGIFPSAAELAGAATAAALWIFIVSRLEWRATIVCSVLATFIAVDLLRPLPSVRFHHFFVPFRSFINGPRESASRVFLEKTFLYGSILWLLRRAGVSLALATLCVFFCVLCLRMGEVYFAGRPAEITDALMVLILAGFLASLPE